MSYGLRGRTYSYETILSLVEKYPEGITSPELRKLEGVHKSFDISGKLKHVHKKSDDNPHIKKLGANPRMVSYQITKSGKSYLKKNKDEIQTDIAAVNLYWVDGWNEDGKIDGVKRPYKKRTPKLEEQQLLLPVEPEIVLSGAAQKVSETLTNLIAANHVAKTAIQEVHCIIAKYFEENEIDADLEKETGLLGTIVDETMDYRDNLEMLLDQTTAVLTDEAKETTLEET